MITCKAGMSKFVIFIADVRPFHNQHRAVFATVWLLSMLLAAIPLLLWCMILGTGWVEACCLPWHTRRDDLHTFTRI